jgi:hypothetical protein
VGDPENRAAEPVRFAANVLFVEIGPMAVSSRAVVSSERL